MKWFMFTLCLGLAAYSAWGAADYATDERWGWALVSVVCTGLWGWLAVRQATRDYP